VPYVILQVILYPIFYSICYIVAYTIYVNEISFLKQSQLYIEISESYNLKMA